MDVAHAILLYGKIDFSRLTADYLSAKFETFRNFTAKIIDSYIHIADGSLPVYGITDKFSHIPLQFNTFYDNITLSFLYTIVF